MQDKEQNPKTEKCSKCGQVLACQMVAEYPGTKAWPYYRCVNNDCTQFGREA